MSATLLNEYSMVWYSLSVASVKSRLVFTFLVPAHLGSHGQRTVKRVCVCVCRHVGECRVMLLLSGEWLRVVLVLFYAVVTWPLS